MIQKNTYLETILVFRLVVAAAALSSFLPSGKQGKDDVHARIENGKTVANDLLLTWVSIAFLYA